MPVQHPGADPPSCGRGRTGRRCRVVATRATQRVRGAAAALFYRARSVAFTPPDRDVTSTPSTVACWHGHLSAGELRRGSS